MRSYTTRTLLQDYQRDRVPVLSLAINQLYVLQNSAVVAVSVGVKAWRCKLGKSEKNSEAKTQEGGAGQYEEMRKMRREQIRGGEI